MGKELCSQSDKGSFSKTQDWFDPCDDRSVDGAVCPLNIYLLISDYSSHPDVGGTNSMYSHSWDHHFYSIYFLVRV